ncbi:MAG: hypothetical protein NTY09_02220 [bacterium]|nr:hypothetical protein [bacterium]
MTVPFSLGWMRCYDKTIAGSINSPLRSHKMNFRKFHVLVILPVIILALSETSSAEVRSLQLLDAFATTPGNVSRVGYFDENSQIDLIFEFDLDSDPDQIARMTWDVYDRYDRNVFSGVRELPCEIGSNQLRVENAIPVDIGGGEQVYNVYASVKVESTKDDTQFEIRIQSPHQFPNVLISDVRLTPREDDVIGPELGDSAIPYTLEVDFRTENIISWARAEIRWHGTTVDAFVLDDGFGSTDVEEGFNKFYVDSLIARPPYGATQEANFSVEVFIAGYYDSVTFPLESLPISLSEIRASSGAETASAFSVGEAYLVTPDGERSTTFSKDEGIVARILTGGITPENTKALMILTGGPDEIREEFMTTLSPGQENPTVDINLPADVERAPGYYNFSWSVMTGETLYAERTVDFTISGLEGINIPEVIELPGGATFTVPLTWSVTPESDSALFATMVTPDGIDIRLMGQSLDQPLNVGLLADIFESSEQNSGIPSDATLLTTEDDSGEGEWESVRRAYMTGEKIYVNEYILYRVESGVFQLLISACVADKDRVTEAYAASDAIHDGIDLGVS